MNIRIISFLIMVLIGNTAFIELAWCGDGTGTNNVTTVSRSVKVFSELENALNEAILKSTKMPLNTNLVADDFEERNAAAPGRPIPRADWIAGSARAQIGEITQMAVHDYVQTAVVSFMSTTPSQQYFVVDVWRKTDDAWVLAIRFISPAK